MRGGYRDPHDSLLSENNKVYLNSYSPYRNDFNYYDTAKQSSYAPGAQYLNQDIVELDVPFTSSADDLNHALTTASLSADVQTSAEIGTAEGSGDVTYTWKGLTPETTYGWYAEVTNDQGGLTRTGVQTFTTEKASDNGGNGGGSGTGGNGGSGNGNGGAISGNGSGNNGATGGNGNGDETGGSGNGSGNNGGHGSADNAGTIVEPGANQTISGAANHTTGGTLSQTGDVAGPLAAAAGVIATCAAGLVAIAHKLRRRTGNR